MYPFSLSQCLVEEAIAFLKGKIRRTPLEYSPELSKILSADAYLKLESLQEMGSFKIRGALFYLSCMKEADRKNGVSACSAGNHGLGIAFAAKQMNVACTVYIPKDADLAKQEKIKKLGALVCTSPFKGYDETLMWAKEQVKKTGQHFIAAFEDEKIMAGNGGTLAAEIIEEMPEVGNIFFPVGGGGLGAGICFYGSVVKPSLRFIACQHQESCALKLSLDQKKAVTKLPAIETIAGGIEGGIGANCFEQIRRHVRDVSLVSEEQIGEAFRWMIKYHQYLIEPTAAVPIASCLFSPPVALKGKTVIVLTGRNVSLETVRKLSLHLKH